MRHARADAGYTLIELLVTTSLLGVVLGAALFAFFQSQDSVRRMTRLVEARQNARAALQLLEREIRMAGSGWGRVAIEGSYKGAPFILNAVTPHGGLMGASDTLEILGGWDASTTLRSAMPNPSAVLQCVSVAGFRDGDFAVVTDGATAHFFQATAVQSPPENLQHNPSSIYNEPGGHSDWPSGGYGAGARVYRTPWVRYRVATTGYTSPCLLREEVGSAPQVIAPDIGAFRVWYLLQDGTWTRSPQNLAMIDRLLAVIELNPAASSELGRADSLWALARPRTF